MITKQKMKFTTDIEIPPGFNKWLTLKEIVNFNFVNFNNNYEDNVSLSLIKIIVKRIIKI